MPIALLAWNGADDYVPKPFNPRELVARIRAIQRRAAPTSSPPPRLEVNGVTLDPAAREVRCDGKPVELTTVEFDILEQLMRAAGRLLSRDALMEAFTTAKPRPLIGRLTCTSATSARSWNAMIAN